MADWKRLAAQIALIDGAVDAQKAAIIRAALSTSNTTPREEAEFLIAVRRAADAARTAPEFHQLVFEVVQHAILRDGEISPAETRWLIDFVFADGVLDEHEQEFLMNLHRAAVVTCPEFDALIHDQVSI
ncbi:MAG: TerB family tellurite resistance protein [Bacteroidales bacterium]|nr:TerB family tellurite resistance protein [Bacteroidales bacterium]